MWLGTRSVGGLQRPPDDPLVSMQVEVKKVVERIKETVGRLGYPNDQAPRIQQSPPYVPT
jgi:hypothetical protein